MTASSPRNSEGVRQIFGVPKISQTPKTGDVLAFRGVMPHSRVIEGWTHSVYSHVAVVWDLRTDDGNRPAVVEAIESLAGGRVRVRPLDRYLPECTKSGCRVDWYRTRGTHSQRQRLVTYCLRQWDKPYVSIWQMLWSFVRLNKWIRDRFGLPANLDRERWFCSELVAAAFMSAGLLDPDSLDPALVTPGDVTRFGCLEYAGQLA